MWGYGHFLTVFIVTDVAKKIRTPILPITQALWKWGHFDKAKLIFKMLPFSWSLDVNRRGLDLFQRGTLDLCGSKDCKVTSCQN